VIAHKFLAPGAVSPFTGFRWPGPGEWVNAPAGREDAWVHACRPGDLPYWLEDELWRIELDEPLREARYHVAAPRARLVSRIAGWDRALGREYARACALRARDLALPYLGPALRAALEGLGELQAIADAVRRAGPPPLAAGFVSDAANNALHVGPATTSYIACMLVSTLGDGLAAFEAERAWQARWLAKRLGLG
jgi:hypothetical protein